MPHITQPILCSDHNINQYLVALARQKRESAPHIRFSKQVFYSIPNTIEKNEMPVTAMRSCFRESLAHAQMHAPKRIGALKGLIKHSLTAQAPTGNHPKPAHQIFSEKICTLQESELDLLNRSPTPHPRQSQGGVTRCPLRSQVAPPVRR